MTKNTYNVDSILNQLTEMFNQKTSIVLHKDKVAITSGSEVTATSLTTDQVDFLTTCINISKNTTYEPEHTEVSVGAFKEYLGGSHGSNKKH